MFVFVLQIILGIFLLFFIYKQMNQNHLDTWFITFIQSFLYFFHRGLINIIKKVRRRIYAEKIY